MTLLVSSFFFKYLFYKSSLVNVLNICTYFCDLLAGAFVVQEDQFLVDIHALSDGFAASRLQRVTCLANDERVRNLTENLLRGQITILHFLQSASNTLQAPYRHVFE